MLQNLEHKVVCITGAAGFIGSTLAEKILASTKTTVVFGVDNFDPYYAVEIKQQRVERLKKNQRFVFCQSEFTDLSVVKKIQSFVEPKIIVHAASKVGLRNGEEQSFRYLENNTLCTHLFLSHLKDVKNIEQLIFLSSSAVYGNSTQLPFTESMAFSIQTHLSLYGVSKLSMELLVHHFAVTTQTPVTIVRPFNIYGPHGRPDMLPMKLAQSAKDKKVLEIFGDNEHNRRDWTYIDDCIDLLTRIMSAPRQFEIVNIGTGRTIGIYELIELAQRMLKEEFGVSLKVKSGKSLQFDTRITCADIKKANELYSYMPKFELEEGLRRTFRYFFGVT